MNKTIVIGDIHGRDKWKRIIDQEKAQNVIFVGDYFDSFDLSAATQIHNFKDILNLKRGNPENVILLIGNHDYHYMSGVNESYSGYQVGHRFDIETLLEDNKDLMKMCHVQDNFLFTHAGVTKTWVKLSLEKLFKDRGIGVNDLTIDQKINEAFKINKKIFGFTSGRKHDPYGNEVYQTPIWVRPESLKIDSIDDYIHVFGHTTTKLNIDLKNRMIAIDSLFHDQFLIIENGEPRVGTIGGDSIKSRFHTMIIED